MMEWFSFGCSGLDGKICLVLFFCFILVIVLVLFVKVGFECGGVGFEGYYLGKGWVECWLYC